MSNKFDEQINLMKNMIELLDVTKKLDATQIKIYLKDIDTLKQIHDARINELGLANQSLSGVIKELQHFKDSSLGLWVTDKPDVIPEEHKELFWELTDNKDQSIIKNYELDIVHPRCLSKINDN